MAKSTAATGKNARVKLVLDGKNVEARGGDTILEVATANGVHIPTLCYLKKLNPIGSCRVCSVEVEGNSGPVMSCVTPVVDGMQVRTDTDLIRRYRQQMIRFILVNHPLDCPVCERSGECSLQNRTMEFNVADQLFFTTEHEKQKVADWGVIRYDRNLCVMCERCVRICHEIQGVSAYKIDGTGIKAKINTQNGEPLDCDFCGQCVSVCPVGALNSGVVLPARSWEVGRVRSICSHCAVGCSLSVETKNNMVARISSVDGVGVNDGNLCARGRFGLQAYQSKDRLASPESRPGGGPRKMAWDAALDEVAGKFRAIVEKNGPDSVAVIAGERLTNEDAYILQKVFRAGLGVNRIDTLSNMRNRKLNSGLFKTYGASAPVIPYSMMEKAGCFLSFGCDMENENPVIANMARVVMRDKGTSLYVANSRNVGFMPHPMARILYDYGAEVELAAALADPREDKDAVAKMAIALAGHGSPLIFIGKEIHDHPNSENIMAALMALAAKLNGWTLLYREYANTQGTNDMGLSPANFPGYAGVEDPDAAAHYAAMWGLELDPLFAREEDIFTALESGKVKGLLVVGADPATHFPNGPATMNAMGKAEYLAVVDSFSTPTSDMAHIVLPACVSVEKDGTYTNNEGRPQGFSRVVTPTTDSKPEWEIFQELGKRFGLVRTYSSTARITEEIAASVKGYKELTTANLVSGDVFVSYPSDAPPVFKFDKGKTKDARSEDFPMLMLTGNSLFHLDSLSRASAALNTIEPAAFVEISSQDAAEGGIADGDDVNVESALGSVRAVARVNGRPPKGVVYMAKGFENAPAMSLVERGHGATAARIRRA
ncbi:MAG: molybdopterin-dependent oxidoreductase [Nitrospinota bacterium]|nr:molybdopterin-dependent oxidoreductase [Nitrospinota bacterium]